MNPMLYQAELRRCEVRGPLLATPDPFTRVAAVLWHPLLLCRPRGEAVGGPPFCYRPPGGSNSRRSTSPHARGYEPPALEYGTNCLHEGPLARLRGSPREQGTSACGLTGPKLGRWWCSEVGFRRLKDSPTTTRRRDREHTYRLPPDDPRCEGRLGIAREFRPVIPTHLRVSSDALYRSPSWGAAVIATPHAEYTQHVSR